MRCFVKNVRDSMVLVVASRALSTSTRTGRDVSGRRWPVSGTYRRAFRRNASRRSLLLRLCRKPFYYFWPRESDISPQAQTRHRISAASARFFIDPRGRDLQARGDFFGRENILRTERGEKIGGENLAVYRIGYDRGFGVADGRVRRGALQESAHGPDDAHH